MRTIEITDECWDMIEELRGNLDGEPTDSEVILGMFDTNQQMAGQIMDLKKRIDYLDKDHDTIANALINTTRDLLRQRGLLD